MKENTLIHNFEIYLYISNLLISKKYIFIKLIQNQPIIFTYNSIIYKKHFMYIEVATLNI